MEQGAKNQEPARPKKIEIATIISIAAIIFAAGGFYYSTQSMKQEINEMKANQKTLEITVARLQQAAQDAGAKFTMDSIYRDSVRNAMKQ